MEVKMEGFEDLKKLILKTIEDRSLPNVLFEEIDKIAQKVRNIYFYNSAYNSKTDEIIYCNIESLKKIMEKLNENRNGEQIEEVSYLFNKIEKNLEKYSTEEKENNNIEDRQNKESISQIDMNSKKMVSNLIIHFKESIENIINNGNRILSTRGVSPSRLEQINNELRMLMYSLEARESEKFLKIIEQDDKKFLDRLIEYYSEYELMEDKKEKSKREKFVEELNAGISLEEQSKNSKMQTNEGLYELLLNGKITKEEYDELKSKHEVEDKKSKNNNELDIKSLPDDAIS